MAVSFNSSSVSSDKVKLRAADLRPGMYVCELDRPWEETPFLLQGFEIASRVDIDAVMQYCDFVYIDLMRTQVLKVDIDATPVGSFVPKPAMDEKDLEDAETTRLQTSSLIKNFIDEIRFGQSLDIQLAKSAVAECVSKLSRNPEAMMFLTRIRQKDEVLNQSAFSVCIYSIVLGRLLGLDGQQLENLGTCGLLHDMGMVTVPEYILKKQGPLTPQEYEIVKTHTTSGRDILMSGRNIFAGSVDVAYGHHENIDGSGYPLGFKGTQTSMNCKIVSIVDKYNAITSSKPYRPAGDHLSAVAILNQLARDGKLDAKLTSDFVTHMGIYPPGTLVEMNTGEVGIVIESNAKQRLRPQVLMVRDGNKQPVSTLVDLAVKTVDDRGRPYRIMAVRSPGYDGIDLTQYYDIIMAAFA